MAVYTYGLTYEDALPKLPFNTDSISATSKVTPDMLTGYIEEASGQYTGALRNAGVAYESLSEDQLAQVRAGITAYAAWQALQALGFAGATANGLRDTYQANLAAIRKAEEVLGTSGSAYQGNTSNTARRFTQTSGW